MSDVFQQNKSTFISRSKKCEKLCFFVRGTSCCEFPLFFGLHVWTRRDGEKNSRPNFMFMHSRFSVMLLLPWNYIYTWLSKQDYRMFRYCRYSYLSNYLLRKYYEIITLQYINCILYFNYLLFIIFKFSNINIKEILYWYKNVYTLWYRLSNKYNILCYR